MSPTRAPRPATSHPYEQQTPEWKTRYAVRSGAEGTVNEFAHGHGMRRCRYRGQGTADIQHVLTAIAVTIERLSGLPPTEEAPSPRRPTAFQNYLDQREIPRPKSWRTLGSRPRRHQDPRQSQAECARRKHTESTPSGLVCRTANGLCGVCIAMSALSATASGRP
ncbi:transposase [Streptomyces sp. NPDC048696]|uniref:transposase n=1 Tax=Streptomyces sp. NPDC048696 TaxID=3365585 RepID=UPI0037139309